MSNKVSYNEKGFNFTIEATISLMLFALMLFSIPEQKIVSLKELVITQQENDLLKVWSAKESTPEEMIQDTINLFNTNAELLINNKKLLTSKPKKNSIACEGIILNRKLEEDNVRIIVYYD